jgi:hypothetical protein
LTAHFFQGRIFFPNAEHWAPAKTASAPASSTSFNPLEGLPMLKNKVVIVTGAARGIGQQ